MYKVPDLKRTKLLRKFIGMEVGRSKYGIRGKKVTKPFLKCSCRDFRCSTLDFTTLSTSTPNEPGFFNVLLPSTYPILPPYNEILELGMLCKLFFLVITH